MSKIIAVVITLLLVAGLGTILLGQPKGDKKNAHSSGLNASEFELTNNVEMREGAQYVTINVRGGYSPRISVAKADIPTKLILKTNGTYDCSASLVIRSIGYQKVLPPIGEEVIDLGIPKPHTLQGACSMGMYNFSVNFK